MMMKNLKIKIKRNGWRLLLSSILFYSLMSNVAFAQVLESNEKALDSIKSKSSKELIEKWIVGYWRFANLTTADDEIIDEVELEIDNIKAYEKVSRPDIIFHANKNYELIDVEKNIVEKGTWFYHENDKVLRLVFDTPKYNVPIEKLSIELIDKLKREGTIIEFTEDNVEIHQISDKMLSIIEHLEHSEYELKYNLRVYTKENTESN